MRVLVTGGFGFTGRAVALTLLAHDHDVVLLTSSHRSPREAPHGASIVKADLRDGPAIAQVVAAGRYDAVCHLAALTRVRDSFADPVTYYDVNVGGTTHLLAGMDAQTAETGRPGRLVFASTGAVYGAQIGHLTEDDVTAPTNPYGASKLAAEQLISHQAATGRLQATTLRCFNIAGAVDGHTDLDTTRIIPKALAVARGRYDNVLINGDGTALREYTHVLDVAEAYRLALEAAPSDRHTIYNLGSGTGVTIAQIIANTRQITGADVPVVHGPAKPEPQILMADSSRLRSELGWTPTRSDLAVIISDGWEAWRQVAVVPA
jgi:UDP-glucose 4-epimerase